MTIIDNFSDERGAILSKPSVNKRQDQIGSIFSATYIYVYIYVGIELQGQLKRSTFAGLCNLFLPKNIPLLF